MKRYKIYDIDWQVDDELASELPTETVIDIEGSGLEDLTEAQLESYGFDDWLADKYGFDTYSFLWKELC